MPRTNLFQHFINDFDGESEFISEVLAALGSNVTENGDDNDDLEIELGRSEEDDNKEEESSDAYLLVVVFRGGPSRF